VRKQAAATPRRRVQAPPRGREMISHPPQLPSYGITRDVRMRFQATAAAQLAFTFQNLLDCVLLATSATAVFDLFEGVRLNSIEMWAIAAVGTPATLTCIFDGLTVGAMGDQKTHTDTSMGVQPAHVKARPDRLTQAGQFQPSSAAVAFRLDTPAGTIIDVSMSYRQPMLSQAVAAQNVAVAATAGAVYYRGLDGKTTALTNYPVIGADSVI
jgi:hypothetical protein